MDFDRINWLAVLVATVANGVLGFLWYGPIFGRIWVRAVGRSQEEMAQAGPSIALSIFSGLIAAFALALILTVPPAADVNVGEGIRFGAIAGIGFAVTSKVTSSAFEGTNSTVTLLFAFYQIVGYIIVGAILGAWH
jgi:uncharacterized protein DUF1761